MSLAAFLAYLLLSTVQVTGDTSCPRAEQVAEQLAPLLVDDRAERGHRVQLASRDGNLMIELVGPDGRTEARRALATGGTCADLAGQAAVVIALWEANLDAGLPVPPLESAVDAPAPRRNGWRVTPSLGLLASASGTGFSPAGELRVVAQRQQTGWGASLGVLGVAEHEQPFVGGSGAKARWSRLLAFVGPTYVAGRGRVRWSADVALAVGRIWIEGDGFLIDRQSSNWDAATLGALRLMLPVGAAVPWVGVVGRGGLRSQALSAQGEGRQDNLPRVEVLAGAGVGFETHP